MNKAQQTNTADPLAAFADRTQTQVLVIGRVGADLYPLQSETPLKAVRDFRRFAGGFATNVATGLARLGVRAAIVSAVGSDGNGDFIREFLEHEGVDTRFLTTDETCLTPLSFCELWPPDNFPITYYRQPTAPDWEIPVTDALLHDAGIVPLLMVSGTGLARSAAREMTTWAMRACRAVTLLDLDYRPTLWNSIAEYRDVVARASIDADILVGNESEVSASGLTPEVVVADDKSLILKRGPAGVSVYAPDTELHIRGMPTEVVNGLGAGDAFAAALGYGLLQGEGLRASVERASQAGAIVAGRLACAAAMPTLAELDAARDSAAAGVGDGTTK